MPRSDDTGRAGTSTGLEELEDIEILRNLLEVRTRLVKEKNGIDANLEENPSFSARNGSPLGMHSCGPVSSEQARAGWGRPRPRSASSRRHRPSESEKGQARRPREGRQLTPR